MRKRRRENPTPLPQQSHESFENRCAYSKGSVTRKIDEPYISVLEEDGTVSVGRGLPKEVPDSVRRGQFCEGKLVLDKLYTSANGQKTVGKVLLECSKVDCPVMSGSGSTFFKEEIEKSFIEINGINNPVEQPNENS